MPRGMDTSLSPNRRTFVRPVEGLEVQGLPTVFRTPISTYVTDDWADDESVSSDLSQHHATPREALNSYEKQLSDEMWEANSFYNDPVEHELEGLEQIRGIKERRGWS